MLKETYLAKMKEMKKNNPDATFIVVMRSADHVLSPSRRLLNDYIYRGITWDEYTSRFLKEMESPECKEEMKKIWGMSRQRDVFLVCHEPPGENCHRHLLINMIKIRFGEHPDTSPPLKG